MTPQTVIVLHSIWVRDMSGTRRFWFGNVSADSTQFGVMSDLIQSRIGLELVSGRPTYARYVTEKTFTIGCRIKTDTSPNVPRQNRHHTDIWPTDNRQLVGERSFKHVWKISPDKFVCPNINRHQRDTVELIPTVNRSLPEFDDFCRFEVSCRFGRCDWGITGYITRQNN